MTTIPCNKCGFLMDALDKECSRCAKGGIVLATYIACPSCGKDNSNKRHACVYCHERLGAPLANVERLSLRAYQEKSTEQARQGDALRALATLREAVDFHPDDVKTRTVLISLLERGGNHGEVRQHQEYLFLLNVRGSEMFARQQADMAFNSGNMQAAVSNFETGLRYHPQSLGDTNRANTEREIAHRLRGQRLDLQHQHQARNDHRAHSNETAAMVAGTAVGVTGAAVGGAITIVSVITGILVALLGVALCAFSIVLFMTYIGFHSQF